MEQPFFRGLWGLLVFFAVGRLALLAHGLRAGGSAAGLGQWFGVAFGHAVFPAALPQAQAKADGHE